MFDWTTNNGYQYLPSWVREIGAMMQVLPILLVPFVAVIQSCRYFLNSNGQERMHEVIIWKVIKICKGGKLFRGERQRQLVSIYILFYIGLFQRVNNLYRPRYNNSNGRNRRGGNNRNRNGVVLTNFNQRSSRQNDGNSTNQERLDDPPPKYTPPPSYSTATGARQV